MNQTIWKYPVVLDGYQIIPMPRGAQVLQFAEQPEQGLALWVLVDPQQPKEDRKFRLASTGQTINEPALQYVGTAMQRGGRVVWHLFEEKT